MLRPGPALAAPASIALAPTVVLHADQLGIAPDGVDVRSRPFLPAQFTADAAKAAKAEQDAQAAAAAVEAGLDAPAATAGDDEAGQALLDVFYANYYVGKVWFSGGYELLPEVGNQVRSLGVSFSLQPDYATQVQEWTDATFAELLADSGVAVSRLDGSIEAALAAPTRRTVRGTGPLDGEDNQNLPRFELEPVALDPAALPTVSADTVLVPIVVHYYAHNGGWFVGQNKGAAAGARFRLLWALHDAKTGAVLTWGDHAARYVEKYFYTPNDVQLQDYLLEVEARIRESLADVLPR